MVGCTGVEVWCNVVVGFAVGLKVVVRVNGRANLILRNNKVHNIFAYNMLS